MPWFRLDDQFHANRKVQAAGTSAVGLYVICGTWCASELTDGFIPTATALFFGNRSTVRVLLSVALWVECEGGYRMPDFLDYNPSREKVLEDRAAAKERMQRARSREHQPNLTGSSATPSPVPIPVPSVVKSRHQALVGEGVSSDDLDLVAKACQSDLVHAARVAEEVLSRSKNVKDPLAYVLRSIGKEPERYKPTHTAPSFHALCDHGQDGRVCIHCKREAVTA